MIVYAHKHGFQLGIHSCGDRAIDACVDGFVKALIDESWDARHYIIHGVGITDICKKRAAENDIGLSVQPCLWKLREKDARAEKSITSIR